MKPLAATNDFVVKFANVNGSGSASANELFARSVLRMGVAVATRNIFPSNIQGLPTWYEVRISGEGWLGRRGGVDLVVPLNPQTWDRDIAEVEPGGYMLYDSTKPLTGQKLRSDITVLGVPFTELSNSMAGTIPRERQLLKNIVYVGALAALLGLDLKVIDALIEKQFKGKTKLVTLNGTALRLGYDYVEKNLKGACGLKVTHSDKVGERIFIAGNDAAGLGAVYGGATVCAWYPITPSTSLAEAFSAHCKRFRVDPATGENKFAIVQAEDEIAAIGMVLGAGWNGTRSFTATSGPGISLMQEFFGFAYYAEIPAVIFDIQRGGPSTGMPTRTQQSDILLAAYASHGDTKHILLFPEDPRESFEFAAQSFDLAERLQTPIFVMMDLDIGMNDWLCEPLSWDDSRTYDRGKLITAEELEAGKAFARYLDVDGDAIPYRTLPGTHPTKGAYFTRGSSHNAYAVYSESGKDYTDVMQRLLRKLETAKSLVPAPVMRAAKEKSRHGVIYFGSTSAAMDEAFASLAAQGVHLDGLRVRAFPFADALSDFVHGHDQVFVIEQNRDAQLLKLIVNECGLDPARFISILHYDGTPITARFIHGAIAERLSVTRKEAAE
ncbi:MAG: 2-oxoacid:acceptor oxidoreductase subunit alpha [Alphaproteobacteria bacterium]|nr:2-oxoacid:acceptor oxidoreductase subunit alpha [Alphaproteobacteria bacterium]MBV9692205.1 2-oxoacid:acceptor oxidoreductase subunit alpha [Alphaproteobacteria bacterium]